MKRSYKEFKVGDHVYLRVKLRKSSLKLESCANLAAIYCALIEILDRIGLATYRIALPPNMRNHNVFHVSLFNRHVHDHNHVIDWNVLQVN